ncbi:MAG: DUF59 domain-containing protein, partial [Gammaproteobacteria bacterium]
MSSEAYGEGEHMAELTPQVIEALLKEVQDPYLGKDLVSAKAVKNIAIEDGKVTVDVVLGYPAEGYHPALIQAIREKLDTLDEVKETQVNITTKIVAHSVQKGVQPLPNVKNIIAV